MISRKGQNWIGLQYTVYGMQFTAAGTDRAIATENCILYTVN